MARTKELHFFDREDIDWNAPPYEELHRHFDFSRPDVRRGETTPIYMYWPDSLKRIRDYNPEARIVAILRHPVYRAYSQWKMQVVRGDEKLSFEEAISEAGRSRILENERDSRRFSYTERGFYGRQVEAMIDLFPRHRPLIVTSDDLRRDPAEILTRICRLLDVDAASILHHRPGYIVAVDSRAVPDIRPQTVAALLEIFRDDILATMRLTGLDLGQWLSPDYREEQI